MTNRFRNDTAVPLGILIQFPQIPARVYADTYVFGGAFDDPFRQASLAFFDRVSRGEFVLAVSEVRRREISTAPSGVMKFFENFAASAIIAAITPASLILRKAYLAAEF